MAKGIRVNQLSEEIGVTSKLVLEKLREEGLGDVAPNHMSVLPLGLAESVREWFSSGSDGTVIETAAADEVVVKPPRVGTPRKKATPTAKEGTIEPARPWHTEPRERGLGFRGPTFPSTDVSPQPVKKTDEQSSPIKSNEKNDQKHENMEQLEKDFWGSLDAAKKADLEQDVPGRNRNLRQAINMQVALIDGWIERMDVQYHKSKSLPPLQQKDKSKWNTLETLCELASRNSGQTFKKYRYKFNSIRNDLNHPAGKTVTKDLPSWDELKKEQERIDAYFAHLEALLK